MSNEEKKLKTSDAQRRATKKWQEKNREKTNYSRRLATTRHFIKILARKEHLDELKNLIKEKKENQLEDNKEKEN